jgi:hypothetical protein
VAAREAAAANVSVTATQIDAATRRSLTREQTFDRCGFTNRPTVAPRSPNTTASNTNTTANLRPSTSGAVIMHKGHRLTTYPHSRRKGLKPQRSAFA